MDGPASELLGNLAVTEDLLAVAAAADLPFDPQECHVGEGTAVLLVVSASVADIEVGDGDRDLVDLLEIVGSLWICNVGFAANDVHDGSAKTVKRSLFHNEDLVREGSGVESDGGADALVTGRTHDDGLEATAGLAHGDGAGRVHHTVILASLFLVLGLEPVELVEDFEGIGGLGRIVGRSGHGSCPTRGPGLALRRPLHLLRPLLGSLRGHLLRPRLRRALSPDTVGYDDIAVGCQFRQVIVKTHRTVRAATVSEKDDGQRPFDRRSGLEVGGTEDGVAGEFVVLDDDGLVGARAAAFDLDGPGGTAGSRKHCHGKHSQWQQE